MHPYYGMAQRVISGGSHVVVQGGGGDIAFNAVVEAIVVVVDVEVGKVLAQTSGFVGDTVRLGGVMAKI